MNVEYAHRAIESHAQIGEPRDIGAEDAYAAGYRRGWDVATSRAESRRRLGLPIEPEERAR